MVKHAETPESDNANQNGLELVVVGSSAGGIEALSILVSTLPTDFPAPVVLAQHLDPGYASNLSSILQRHTMLKVEIVTSSSLMQPGTIYVVPSNNNVIITDGHVAVQEASSKRPYPSIDLLLSTAATVYGERLIAVILTGAGSDGAAGGIAVKQAGGTVIIQNPQTASYPSMPLSLPPTIVDFESDIELIGPLLYDLLNRIKLPLRDEKTGDTLEKILNQVRSNTKFDFRTYKLPTIARRLARRMLTLHINTMLAYSQYLEAHPEEISKLVNAFLINVTHFFRDTSAFTYLKTDLLPQLIEQARKRDRVLRFWSAGCSTGEEAYSLIMLLADLLGDELSQWTIKIFATDLDEAAIAFARRGMYSAELLKGLPAGYQSRFFEPTEHGYRVSKMLRQMIIFGEHDLNQNGPFPQINLVRCRNVLIYFSKQLQEDVLGRFTFSLKAGGYLFLGKSETIGTTMSQYELVNKAHKIYRCSRMALPSPRHLNLSTQKILRPLKRANIRGEGAIMLPLVSKPFPEPDDLAQTRHLNDVLANFLPMGIITIDRTYHILTANTTVRRLLGIAEIAVEQDLLHVVRGIPYNEVRKAIDTAFRERKMVTLPNIELNPKLGGNGRFITLSIAVLQEIVGNPEIAAISVSDITEQVQIRQQLEAAQLEQSQMVEALRLVNESLNARNEELLNANERLHIANEEAILTQEQLQASLEEFETTNEELQASNEELETANEEAQASNEELQTLNQEASARNAEVLELTSAIEREHAILKEIINVAPYYILVLRGPDLRIQAFNAHYADMLGAESIQGRSLEDVAHLFWVMGNAVVTIARDAYRRDTPVTTGKISTRFTDAQGEASERYLIANIVPTHDTNGQIYGLVVYTEDVTLRHKQEIQEELERLRLIFDRTEKMAVALYDAQTTTLIMANVGYLAEVERNSGLSRREVIGKPWLKSALFVPSDQGPELWDSVLKNREPLRLPEVHTFVDGDQQHLVWDALLAPIIYAVEPETVRFILISAVEITEQVRARQVSEEANQLKGRFLAMVSHELRTPLTSIKGFATTLLATDVSWDADQQRQFITIIDEESNKLMELIDQLLDLSRLQAGTFRVQLEPQKIDTVIHAARPELEALTSNHPLRMGPFTDLPLVNMDVHRIAQVLVNLVGNAAKFSPSGTPIEVSFLLVGDRVQVNVSDHGPGIPVADQHKVFEAFLQLGSTSKLEKGTGLGLSICKGLIEAHGGKIWIADKPEPGTMVSFTLLIAS